MRLILDPAQDAAHGDRLRATPGAYEWWYFDALSDDGQWALACIWFLGNPFSPYYRLSALGKNADPYGHNALFFALYRHGCLHTYHFTRFAPGDVRADETRPACLQFGPNALTSSDGRYALSLADENANRRTLAARLTFDAPPLVAHPPADDGGGDSHFWLPAAPHCRVAAQITLREPQNPDPQTITFQGSGYHDHNWGALPFARDVRDWYWARASLSDGSALIVYHVRHHGRPPISHLLHFQSGRLLAHDAAASVTLRRPRLNAFAAPYAARLDVRSGATQMTFTLGARLDSAPFYIRVLCRAQGRLGDTAIQGVGLGEYFRPRMLAWPLVASATKARIVERL